MRGLGTTSGATRGAPHVRAPVDLAWVMRAWIVALSPCAVLGLYDVGHQADRALAELGLERAPGWRGELLTAVGVASDPQSVFACVLLGALHVLPLFLVVLAVALGWARIFALARGRDAGRGVVVVALLFTLSLPPTLSPWQAAVGASFGVVVGMQLFGGTGRYVFHPVVVGLAFLYFAYPEAMRGSGIWVAAEGNGGSTAVNAAAVGGLEAVVERGFTWWRTFLGLVPGPIGHTSTLGCLLGGVYLVLARIVSWRLVAGVVLGAAGTALVLGWLLGETLPAARVPWHWHLVLGSLAFGAVFLVTDPTSAAATDAGRWILGLFVGSLTVLIRVASPIHTDGTLLALLLGNVFAPLIDHGVVRAHVHARRRRMLARGAG